MPVDHEIVARMWRTLLAVVPIHEHAQAEAELIFMSGMLATIDVIEDQDSVREIWDSLSAIFEQATARASQLIDEGEKHARN